jgi:hypothetical protein
VVRQRPAKPRTPVRIRSAPHRFAVRAPGRVASGQVSAVALSIGRSTVEALRGAKTP